MRKPTCVVVSFLILSVAALVSALPVSAQQGQGSLFTAQIRDQQAVRDALSWLDGNLPAQIREWIHITEIPAKSTFEAERAAYVKAQMEAEGLEVSVDSIGNVVGIRRGLGGVGTVQEELGLNGMRYWFQHNAGVADMLVAMDGGLGPIGYGALGIEWTRYWFRSEGGHTNVSTGKPRPVRALADAVHSIYELRIPEGRGGAVYNIGMIGGGKIFNAIPQDIYFTMDLRSVNGQLLDSLDAEITARVRAAAEANGVRWDMERVRLGLPNGTIASGSTDGNIGVGPGIPTIAVGRSRGGNQHTITEWADGPSALPATKAIVLLAVSLAGVGPAA